MPHTVQVRGDFCPELVLLLSPVCRKTSVKLDMFDSACSGAIRCPQVKLLHAQRTLAVDLILRSIWGGPMGAKLPHKSSPGGVWLRYVLSKYQLGKKGLLAGVPADKNHEGALLIGRCSTGQRAERNGMNWNLLWLLFGSLSSNHSDLQKGRHCFIFISQILCKFPLWPSLTHVPTEKELQEALSSLARWQSGVQSPPSDGYWPYFYAFAWQMGKSELEDFENIFWEAKPEGSMSFPLPRAGNMAHHLQGRLGVIRRGHFTLSTVPYSSCSNKYG